MTQTIILFIGVILAFLIGLFTSKKSNTKDAKVIDLTGKIKQNQDIANKLQLEANKKIEDYNNALKAYDPTFHDDDGDGKPSA